MSRKLHSPNVLVFFCGYSCNTLLFDDNNAKISIGSPCRYLRLWVVDGGTNEVNPLRRHQKFIMTNIMCSTLCHSNRGDASNPPKNIIRREIFAKRPPKKKFFFQSSDKKKLIILYSSTVNPIRLHTVINFTFLNFSSIVDASLDNSNLINYI